MSLSAFTAKDKPTDTRIIGLFQSMEKEKIEKLMNHYKKIGNSEMFWFCENEFYYVPEEYPENLKEVKGSVLTSPSKTIIAHQIAPCSSSKNYYESPLQELINKQYPGVSTKNHQVKPRTTYIKQDNLGRIVANMCCDAKSLFDCLEVIVETCGRNVQIAIPYKMGCTSGSGNWRDYEKALCIFCREYRNVTVTIYKYEP